MTGAQGFRSDEARFTPITVAGSLAIIGLCGVLAGSVLQSGAGGRSLAPRLDSARALSQAASAATSLAATPAAVVPLPTTQPALTAASVPALSASPAAIAGSGGVSAGTLAPTKASGSSPPLTSLAAAPILATRPTQALPAADPQSQSARTALPQFTPNVARVAAAPVSAANAAGSSILQATEEQVLGAAATTTPGASLGIDPMTAVQPSAVSGPTTDPGTGLPVNTNPPFPGVRPYVGAISTQAEAYEALGLPAEFQFGAEPDPYVVGSYKSFVADAAAGDKAAQAGLDLATSQGANFSGFN